MKGQESGIQLKQRLTGNGLRLGTEDHVSLHRSYMGTKASQQLLRWGQCSHDYTRCFLKIKDAPTVLFLLPTHGEYETKALNPAIPVKPHTPSAFLFLR